jgi:hypothetical protein
MEAGASICYGNGRSIEWRARNIPDRRRYENMASNGLFAEVAALAGDPGRASMGASGFFIPGLTADALIGRICEGVTLPVQGHGYGRRAYE